MSHRSQYSIWLPGSLHPSKQTWQIVYPYAEPQLFPKGTILHTVSWHDNTTNNRHNPDPSAWIGWGARTMDEMGHGWTDIAFMTDEQYEARVAERAAKKMLRANNNN